MDAKTRGAHDREIALRDRQAFASATHCNDNGACFNYDPSDVMCPSYRVTRDRLQSPKGRAGAMREWLRQLNQAGITVSSQSGNRRRSLWRAAARDALRRDHRENTDFSHEVWQAMDGCLSCRACATQCPIKVDVPAFKSRFLAFYHSRYRRPLSDYALAMLEPLAASLSRIPHLANLLIGSAAGKAATERLLGISDAPHFNASALSAHLRRHPEQRYSPAHYRHLDHDRRARAVFIVQDAFTSFFDSPVLVDVLRLIARLGYHPMLLPFHANGKALHVKGFFPEFQRTADRTAAYLREVFKLDLPLVGIDPSVTLTYREEYPATLGQHVAPRIALIGEWLADVLAEGKTVNSAHQRTDGRPGGVATHTLFQHCTAATACPGSFTAWQTAFRHMGLGLEQIAE